MDKGLTDRLTRDSSHCKLQQGKKKERTKPVEPEQAHSEVEGGRNGEDDCIVAPARRVIIYMLHKICM
jgi:hypothetical protein